MTVNAEIINIYMSQSIDGNTYHRNNICDTFVLHWAMILEFKIVIGMIRTILP